MTMEGYKRGMSLMDAAYMAIGFVVFVVSVAVGGQVLAGVQSGQTANSVAYNATGYGLTGITNLANQSGTIGTIIGAVVIIGLLLGVFLVSKKD